MNDKAAVYKLTKENEEFIGTAGDIAREFHVNEATLSGFFKRGRFHGYDVEKIGSKRKTYSLYKGDELIKRGTAEEVSREIYVHPSRIIQTAKSGQKMFKEYTVKFEGFIFVKAR